MISSFCHKMTSTYPLILRVSVPRPRAETSKYGIVDLCFGAEALSPQRKTVKSSERRDFKTEIFRVRQKERFYRFLADCLICA